MILVGDVHIVTRPHIVSDFNTEVANNSTATTNETSVSNTYNWVCDALLTWHHAGGQRNIWSDQCMCTNSDVLLIEDCGRLPHDETALTESTKFLAT